MSHVMLLCTPNHICKVTVRHPDRCILSSTIIFAAEVDALICAKCFLSKCETHEAFAELTNDSNRDNAS